MSTTIANNAANIQGKTVALADGATTISAAWTYSSKPSINAGLQFPAVQAPSADVNTLDDYEEGSWTPVIGGSGGTSGQTYGVQIGTYIKIGQLVIATFRCDFTAKGTITGNLQIQGLPFTVNTGPNVLYQCPLIWATTATTWTNIQAQLTNSSGTTATVQGVSAAAAAFTTLTTADMGNATILGGTLIYRSLN